MRFIDKLKTFMTTLRVTAFITIIGLITVIYSIFSNGIAGGNWMPVLWCLLFYIIIVAMVFCFEYPNKYWDPDTPEYKNWQLLGTVIFIIAFIFVCIMGHTVMSLW